MGCLGIVSSEESVPPTVCGPKGLCWEDMGMVCVAYLFYGPSRARCLPLLLWFVSHILLRNLTSRRVFPFFFFLQAPLGGLGKLSFKVRVYGSHCSSSKLKCFPSAHAFPAMMDTYLDTPWNGYTSTNPLLIWSRDPCPITDSEGRAGHRPPAYLPHLLQRAHVAGVLGRGEAHQAPQEGHHGVRRFRAQVAGTLVEGARASFVLPFDEAASNR